MGLVLYVLATSLADSIVQLEVGCGKSQIDNNEENYPLQEHFLAVAHIMCVYVQT